MTNPTSHSLIDAVKSTRDEERSEGWQRLWSVYSKYVHYRIRRTGADENDIDDIAQDVFNSVAQKIADFTPAARVGSFRTWLGLIVRHRVADYYRNQKKSVGAGEASGRTDALRSVADPSVNIDDNDESESAEIKQIYERALALAMSEFEETTVIMFRQSLAEERSTKDIADEHGVSSAAVRMAKSRVLRRLRELLGEADDSL